IRVSMSIIKGVTLEEEMKKNPQLKLSDIQSLREWCKKQPHLPKIEDNFLVLFLHSNYYQMEPTKNTIENYYTTRTHLPEIFCNRDPFEEKSLRQSFKIAAILSLNGLTKDGYTMIFSTFLDSDLSFYDYNNTIKQSIMLSDIHLLNGTNDGYVFIFDVGKFSFGHVMKMNPLDIKKHVYYLQEALPIRLKAIHILNATPAMELCMNIAKTFMKNELIDIIHFHSSLESISEYIPVDALPNETGGKAGSVHKLAEIQVKELEDNREWFILDELTNRVNETLRISKNKTANDLFGIEVSMFIIKGVTLEEEMKKNPQLKLSDIQSLREWCKKQPHLPKIEDYFLALFLHSNYYQMESTKIQSKIIIIDLEYFY
ncbi:TTPAL protein, partial [Pseudoatta argentina]